VSLSLNYSATRVHSFDAQAIWLLSPDTQLGSGGEGDETQIDYNFYFQTFLRQICEGLRNKSEWAIDLFRYWDDVLFPNTDHSLGQTPSVNRQAVGADIEAMDEAFLAAAQRREETPGVTSPSRERDASPPLVLGCGTQHRDDSREPSPPLHQPSPPPTRARNAGNHGRTLRRRRGSTR
jgi:hypothetical protein